MLTPEDRRAIEGLFDRLKTVEARGATRDPEAEALIRQNLTATPGASYYLAQTVLVQEHALSRAEERIADLEAEVAQRQSGGGGFFGSLFGGASDARSDRTGPRRAPHPRQAMPFQPGAQGGGFLAGAAQTAMGVAGGVLLGNAIMGMLTPDMAAAEPFPPEDAGAAGGADDGAGMDGFDMDGEF